MGESAIHRDNRFVCAAKAYLAIAGDPWFPGETMFFLFGSLRVLLRQLSPQHNRGYLYKSQQEYPQFHLEQTSSASLIPNSWSSDQDSLQITWHLRSNLVNTEKRPLLILLLEYGECWLKRRVRDRRLQKLHSNASHHGDIIAPRWEHRVPASNPFSWQSLTCVLYEFSFQPGMKIFSEGGLWKPAAMSRKAKQAPSAKSEREGHKLFVFLDENTPERIPTMLIDVSA